MVLEEKKSKLVYFFPFVKIKKHPYILTNIHKSLQSIRIFECMRWLL